MNELLELEAMSNRYGTDPQYVLAGGGNTSYKNDTTLYVKGSGTSLATIKAADFVSLDERSRLAAMWEITYSENEAEREGQVLADMMSARVEGENRRPSVETLLHDLFPQRFVLHVHPAAVNAMTCAQNGKQIASELFPESVWVDACLLFPQNHSVFFAGNTVKEIDALVCDMYVTYSSIRSRSSVHPTHSEATSE